MSSLRYSPASLLALTLTVLVTPLNAQAGETVQVYAAASLTDAMDSVIARYESNHDVDIVPVYASSSTLARQIANGAPAAIYLSANEQWMNWLAEQDTPIQQRMDLLDNRLVLIAPDDSDLSTTSLDGSQQLVSLLKDGERLSVGDTDHVPAGIYARQALTSLDQWTALAPRLANGDNVRAAMALVERHEAPLGIVYQTDAAASDGVKTLGVFPDATHDPITYPMAIVSAQPSEATQAFRAWLAGDTARSLFSGYGFTPASAD
ncbi:molybdate ABC transporter substrate-binding protein [Salinicola aestuarinus]|uniref:molybdate ABC transporter substrate-binding protein n=1 Tax=Salinicola aestuarinus TaxID=1949082 RepID=UPI000DA1DB8A|nr:molybdate ABC transporter substrate-binding protein [Salinicola aestuarinus]